MGILEIQLPDDLRARLAARARENGYDRVEDYVESLLRADVGEDGIDVDDALEQLLLQRLDSGHGVECTPQFIEQFKQQVAQRRQNRGQHP